MLQLIEMTCLRLKLVFPKDSPQQLSFRYSGTRVRITKNNLKSTLWTVNEYKTIMTGNETDHVDNGKEMQENLLITTIYKNVIFLSYFLCQSCFTFYVSPLFKTYIIIYKLNGDIQIAIACQMPIHPIDFWEL